MGDLTNTFTLVKDFEELAFKVQPGIGRPTQKSAPKSLTSPTPRQVKDPKIPKSRSSTAPITRTRTKVSRTPRLNVDLDNIDRDMLDSFEKGPFVSAQQRRLNVSDPSVQQTPQPLQDPAVTSPQPPMTSPQPPITTPQPLKKKPGPKAKPKPERTEAEKEKAVRLQAMKRLENQKESLQVKMKTQQDALDSAKAQIEDQIKRLKIMEHDNTRLKSKVESLSQEVVHLTRKCDELRQGLCLIH